MSVNSRKVIIDVNDVYKSFRVYFDKGSMLKEQFVNPGRSRYEEREILKGISFKVHRGETVALIGQNGCGKSTTLKMLTKILYPNKGTVTVNGKVSSLIELGAGFHPDMSGRENIYINASILGIKKEEVDKRIDEIIRFSELEEFIDNPIRTYSSGMYMRLAFSVAINVDADVLLIDEILAVGDQAFQEKCIRKMDELRASGVTVVLVSHSMGQIKDIADRCIWIENGQIREDGDTEEVCDHYEEAMTRRREERDELEEEQRHQEAEKFAEMSGVDAGTMSDGVSGDGTGVGVDEASLDKESRRKLRKARREAALEERKKRAEAFSSKWQGGGIQGKPVAGVALMALMVLHAVCTDVFLIGYEDLAGRNIVPVIETSFAARIFAWAVWVLGRVGIPMLLILLGFEVLPKDFSSSKKRFEYYKNTFLPVLLTWEIWVIVYHIFLYVWFGTGFNVSEWVKEALLIKYVDLSHAWIFRFIMLFLLIAPYVGIILQSFNVGVLRFLMIIGWVLFFFFPGLDYYGQANGGEMSFPQSLGTFCYFFYFCLGFLVSRYMQRIFKGSKEVLFFVASFVLTVWSQLFLSSRGIDYTVKATYFGVSLMALFGFDLLVRFKVDEMYPKVSKFFNSAYKCVLGMYFIYVPVEMMLIRYVFKLWIIQENGDVVRHITSCLGLWAATFVVSMAAVWICKLGVKKIIGR